MKFTETCLGGAFVIEPERLVDERGYFARTWCTREYEARGLNPRFVQCNTSYNRKKGVLRGMHFQAPPHAEAKLVRCTRGSVFEVIIDLRKTSPTYTKHFSVTLNVDNGQMLYIPEGFAQGFQTLEDDTEILYQMSEYYAPEYGRGVRWDDPVFRIAWPPADRIINSRDRNYPDFLP